MRTTLAALVLVACGPRFSLDQTRLTCPEPFHPWAGGLTNHVMQGNGNGSFAYAPASDVIELIDGNYDLKTGDFWWYEYYTDGAWRTQDYALGYGTIWPDGDLDVQYDLRVDLLDGRAEEFAVREFRYGCDTQRRVEAEDGSVMFFEGTFSGGELDYTHTWNDGVREYVATGSRESDGDWTESFDVEDGDFRYRLTDDGTTDLFLRREVLRTTATTELDGHYEQQADGTLTAGYTFAPASGADETWAYDLDFEGNGSGSLDYAQQHCDLTFSDGDCEADGCNRSGPCESPLIIEEVLVRL